MTDLLLLLLSVLLVLAATYVPGYAVPRALGGSRLLSLAIAPAVAAGIAGTAALIAPFLGVGWSLLPHLGLALVLVGLAVLLRRWGVRLPGAALEGRLMPPRTVLLAPVWVTLAAALAVVPIAVRARTPGVVLERWDTLYHLSALQRIRETGTASSLDVGSVSSTVGEATAYPAAFHALASLVPGVPVPIVLNGAVLALALVPWVLGSALLALAVFPEVAWAPFAAAIGAAIVPAAPLDEWIHLSAIPNLVGFAALPGALAAVLALWQALLPGPTPTVPTSAQPSEPAVDAAPTTPGWRPALAALAIAGLAALGLGLLHPNVAVMALLLTTVLTAATALRERRRRRLLWLVPVLCAIPVLLLALTPLAAAVTGFQGGLQVPWWSALGEILLGLLTVWPMALGMILAALWWPGLVRTLWRGPARWVGVAWIVVAVLYLDSAVDSPLGLSTLWYRGQDRLSMPLAMLSVLLIVPGLQVWGRLRGPLDAHGRRPRPSRPVIALLVVLALAAGASSIPTRLDNAAKNLSAEYSGRGRFLQQDELEAWAAADPTMDHSLKVLASPFSGASHMYAIHGQQVYFPVAGMALENQDRALLYALSGSNGEVPAAQVCDLLHEAGVGYVYQEQITYQWSSTFDLVNRADPAIGTVVFETDHSRLIAVDCEGTT